jgi:hypothetical protein
MKVEIYTPTSRPGRFTPHKLRGIH